MRFIDSHCHLPDLSSREKLENILANAKMWNVEMIINIGTSIKENVKSIEVANAYQNVYLALGIYPHEDQGENPDKLISKLKTQISLSKKVVAVGECGLDITNWKKQRSIQEQITLFEAQIRLASQLNLPIIIHNRNADEIIVKILKESKELYPNVRGVVHCFDSNWEVAQKFLELGFYISFSGKITYPNQEHLLRVVQKAPADKYILETDSPYLLPEPIKSESKEHNTNQKNEPKYVRIIGQKVAEVRHTSLERVSAETTNNAIRLFGLPL